MSGWRDPWAVTGVLGTLLACVACLTPAAVLLLGALGLAAWAGYVDLLAVPLLFLFLGLVLLRFRRAGRPRGAAESPQRPGGSAQGRM